MLLWFSVDSVDSQAIALEFTALLLDRFGGLISELGFPDAVHSCFWVLEQQTNPKLPTALSPTVARAC